MEKIKLDPFISELLYEHDCVIIADFGGFVANYKSSFLHTSQHTLSPPSKKIAFNASLKINDGLLASFIAENNDLSYQEACSSINKYVEESLNLLDTGKKLHIDSIGSLFYNPEKKIQFVPDNNTNYLLDSFGLDTIHSPAIIRDTQVKKISMKQPEITLGVHQKYPKKKRQSWRWIELVPAAAILTLLFLNPVVVRNLSNNLASLIPITHTTTTVKKNIAVPEKNQVGSVENQTSLPVPVDPAAAWYTNPSKEAITPGHQPPLTLLNETPSGSEPAVKTEKNYGTTTKEKEITTEAVHSTLVSDHYFIVAGCFRIEENAKHLHEDLLSKGYASEMIGKYKGLHVVTFKKFDTATEARQFIVTLKGTNLDAWVLKK